MKKTKSSTPVICYSKKITALVNEYSVCVTKTATSILELANVVYRAKEDLSKDEYKEFRIQINADKSKDSYLKKLHCIAKNAARFQSIKDKLPATYTTLYTLTKLSDDEFEYIRANDAIKPNLTANELSKFKFKRVQPASIVSNVEKFSIQTSSAVDLKQFYSELEKLCRNYKIELFSNTSKPLSNALNEIDIQDVTSKPSKLAA